MDGNRLSLILLSGGMSDDVEHQRRQGFWLRMARERAGKSQAGAAEYLGLSKASKSTISDYENGVTEVPQRYLRRLAGWYGVPLRTFTEPERTAFDRLDEIAREAIAEAVLIVDAEEASAHGVDAPRAPRRSGRVA
jgi:transcriptional regulator with XRE-family HTH domain